MKLFYNYDTLYLTFRTFASAIGKSSVRLRRAGARCRGRTRLYDSLPCGGADCSAALFFSRQAPVAKLSFLLLVCMFAPL
ncbi:hypothetical protein B4109_1838 [Geobacillus stearothermophilus]|uniref:Uncharacterized protein n=1 Tax=Geobacillus stearothermophilus TaxID=1422 RepID=A0A150M587_GEOSE|nr:hypothetical protein B4109_1838 [Geobacillus stearothermophilus]